MLKQDNQLFVYWTRVGDSPERILRSTIDLGDDWQTWRNESEQEVLRPEHDWEGAARICEPSMRSVAYGEVNQLRDPAIFSENGTVYLLYVIAGEAGIAIARLD